MYKKVLRRLNHKGSALLVTLVVVIMLLFLGIGVLSLGLHGRLMSFRTGSEMQARAAADAGLTKALFTMNQVLETKTWNKETIPTALDEALPNCRASFTYKVSPASQTNRFTVKSTGKADNIIKTVSAIVRLKGLFESALLVQDNISLMPNTIISGYNSADPTDSDIDLKIGTTSTQSESITLGPGTVVEGNVFVGIGGDPEIVVGAGGTITGEKYALTEEIELPRITPPSLPATGTALNAKGTTITLKPGKSGEYTGINLTQTAGSDGILEITSGHVDLYITGNIFMGQGCQLIIRPGSSLNIYIDGDIDADSSVGFNNEAGNIKDFQLYGTGSGEQVFDLKPKTKIFGLIYAPQAEITLYPGTEVCGSIVGDSVQFKSGCTFYYDEALQNASVYDEGVRFVIESWRE